MEEPAVINSRISVRAISDVEVVGWFPNDERQVLVEVTVNGGTFIRRLVLPKAEAAR